MKPDKPSDRERLEHILHAFELIQSFTVNYSKSSFLADEKTISASLFQYTVIAEAIENVDPSLLVKYNYPWNKVKSFRNFITHEYHAIEMRVIWDTTTEILPELKELIVTILKKEF